MGVPGVGIPVAVFLIDGFMAELNRAVKESV